MNVESTPTESWAPLADLSQEPLNFQVSRGSGIVEQALSRVLHSLHDKDGVISSFTSFISEA